LPPFNFDSKPVAPEVDFKQEENERLSEADNKKFVKHIKNTGSREQLINAVQREADRLSELFSVNNKFYHSLSFNWVPPDYVKGNKLLGVQLLTPSTEFRFVYSAGFQIAIETKEEFIAIYTSARCETNYQPDRGYKLLFSVVVNLLSVTEERMAFCIVILKNSETGKITSLTRELRNPYDIDTYFVDTAWQGYLHGLGHLNKECFCSEGVRWEQICKDSPNLN
jgi:hypothetical protein